MSLDLASIPLAWLAGMLTVLSPCVWPLVPVVMSSAATGGRAGPWLLALGLSTSFAVVGTVLTFVFLNLGLDTEIIRYAAALLLLLIAVMLLWQSAGDRVAAWLSRISGNLHVAPGKSVPAGQFGVGVLLGVVWLPCVGPTLGAAIALASMGQDMIMAFVVMFTFGLGTAAVLLFAGVASHRLLMRTRPGLLQGAGWGRKVLGWTLLLLAVLVISGVDKILEEAALGLLPDWAILI